MTMDEDPALYGFLVISLLIRTTDHFFLGGIWVDISYFSTDILGQS